MWHTWTICAFFIHVKVTIDACLRCDPVLHSALLSSLAGFPSQHRPRRATVGSESA